MVDLNNNLATIVETLDDNEKVVINKGAEHGIKEGHRFLIYSIGDELFDPDTGDSLGNLEIVKGTGKVTHVQSRMATVESDRVAQPDKKIVKKKTPNSFMSMSNFNNYEEEIITTTKELLPFDNPEKGDKAKLI